MSSSPGLPDLPPAPGNGIRRGDPALRGGGPRPGPGRSLARANPPGPPAVLAGPPTPASLLRGLQRHLPLALSLGLILGGLASAAAWALYNPTRFRTSSSVRILSVAPTVVQSNRSLVDESLNLDFYLATQSTLLRSDMVLNKALGYPGISDLPTIREQEDPISWLGSSLQVGFSGEIMTIGLYGDRDRDIIAIVNAVTNAYIKEVAGKEKENRQTRANWLNNLITKMKITLEERKQTLRTLAHMTGSSDRGTLAFRQQLLYQDLASRRSVVDEYDREISELQVQISLLTGKPLPEQEDAAQAAATAAATQDAVPDVVDVPIETPEPDPRAIAAAVEADPNVVQARAHYDQLLKINRRHIAAARGGASDPAAARVQDDLRTAARVLSAARDTARASLSRPGSSGTAATATAAGGNDLVFLAKRLEILRTFRRRAAAEYETAKKAIESLNSDTLDLQENQQEIQRMELTLDQLNDQHERLKIELTSPDRITLLENAARATSLSSKKKLFITAAAGGGTLGTILLLFAWFDARNRRVGQIGEVVEGLGMELVGTLPALPSQRARRSGGTAHWESLLMESVDATRTMLVHASRAEQIQVVMITSAIKGEGKTSLTSHLATSLARSQRRTLLIDGDLRSPMLHKLFDLPRTPGLAEFLRGEVELADILQATPAPNLTLITAGQIDPAALAALAAGRIQPLLDAAREQYDFILIDTPPILPVADTLQLAPHVDAALFSVLRDVSRLPKIHEAYSRLSSLGVRMLGTVVAGAQTHRDSSYTYPYAGSAS
jgi:capsular exopolysaccharide synthesis family protein